MSSEISFLPPPEFTDEERNYQYSPSKWSKRDFNTPDDVVNDHCNTVRQGSAAMIKSVREAQSGGEDGPFATLNVVHTKDEAATKEASLDVFYPLDSANGNLFPVVVYLHGGYWQALEKSGSCWHANTFRKNGIGF